MKKILLILLASSIVFADLNINQSEKNQIDALVDAIKEAPIPPAPKFKNPFFRVATTKARVVTEAPKKSALILSSIVANRALINGRWVKVGEVIAGWKLDFIHLDYVLLDSEGRKMQLPLEKVSKSNFINKADQ